MFSGIIEATARTLEVKARDGVVELTLERPPGFDDVGGGDSIAVDGVCLTIERFDDATLTFALGRETLNVTGWTPETLARLRVNLERSLRFGDRVHGHIVTGHVDARTKVERADAQGENLTLTIQTPERLRPYVWSKGSIAVNGVSLTINQVTPETFNVGLIPETLKRTNLAGLAAGGHVNLEVDNMARGLVHRMAQP